MTRALALLIALGVCTPALAHAQNVTVTGVVTDRTRGTAIPNAQVRVSGVPAPRITDDAGRFRVEGVAPGRHLLTVEAIGYHARTIDIVIQGDTTLRIDVEPAPLPMNPLTGRSTRITIKGSVRDAQSGEVLLQAQVFMQPGNRTIGARSGDFTIRNIPTGDSVILNVEAMEHLPRRVAILAERDTAITVALPVDSVRLAMIRREMNRLATRAKSVPFSLRGFNSDALRKTGAQNIRELLRRNLPTSSFENRPPYDLKDGAVVCLALDDRESRWHLVSEIPIDMVERVEFYGLKGRMVRIYSKRYIASLITKEKLPSIVFMENGLNPTCR